MARLASVAIALALLAACGSPPTATPRSEASRIEKRLLAPCCWNQTLDIHESELASTLRTEIRQRVAHGESAEHIENDMVARYGARVRAAPAQRDPLLAIAAAVSALFAAIALWLFARGRRSTARRSAGSAAVSGDADARMDERIDRELRALDD